MKIKLLFICIYVSTIFCEENSIFYCVTDSDYGLTVTDNFDKKDTSFYFSTKYSENVTRLNISVTEKWKAYSPMNTSVFKGLVLDERWESFQTNKDNAKEYESLLSNASTHPLFFSLRIYNNTLNLSKHLPSDQWFHLKVENNTVFLCNFSKCDEQFNITDPTEFFTSTSTNKNIWKLHNYIYFETNTKNTTTNIYNATSMDCTQVQRGWIKLHVAMCAHCTMSFNLQPNDDTNRNETFQQNGTGQWETITHIFENFTSCFNLSLTTMDINEDESFWAIGDRLYFSNNHSCNNFRRYIEFNTTTYNMSHATCELSVNTRYNFISELPKAQCVEPTPQNRLSDKTVLPKTKTSSFASIYLLILIPLAVIVGIALVLYVFRRKFEMICKHTRNCEEDMQPLQNREYELLPLSKEETHWPPIKISEFDDYIRKVFTTKKKENYLEKQFSELPSGFLKDALEGQKADNIEKNRYNKIYPYDENRVVLEKSLGEHSEYSNYINASYVQGFSNSKEYILTQNPLKNTVIDFFRMIWQEQVEYIVMISSNDESYYRYLPDLKKTETYDGIEVFVDEFKSYEFYDYRVLLIRRYGQNRELKHLHFHSWSPLMLSSHVFLEFINHLLKIPHETSPVVFHCLAGIGRSATIVLCDIALRSAIITGNVNFFDITKELRKCRVDLVPNLSQYQLAHLIVFESLRYKDISHDVNSDFSASFSRLFEGNSIKKKWSTYLENTDWLYEALKPYEFCTEHPLRNRYVDNNLLPAKHSRVPLQYKQPDYVHAMFVNTYIQRKTSIVAQQPLPNTVSDFWIMIFQNQVQTVINLNEPDMTLRGNVQFIPTPENKIIKIQGNITIQFNGQEEHLNYEKLHLEIYSSGKFEKNVTVVNVKNWPKIKNIPESTDIMISIWEATREQKIQNFPILVCCDDGITSSSLVVCFFYMADKMLQQRKCDIVGAVKAVRRSHTKFINFEQFVFLHHCALAFYKNCLKLNTED